MTATLHYIYDPLCGWCYGAEPLVNAALSVDGLTLELHGGGLWPRPTQLPEETRRYIQQADVRIAAMSGQPFGAAYLEGLLLDPELVLDSKPTTAAVLAAASLAPSKTIGMLQAIQHAHYERGRHVVLPCVLADIADELGLDRGAFEQAFDLAAADTHIAATQNLMRQVGAAGFPTFVLQLDDKLFAVPHQNFAADAAGFAAWLKNETQAQSSTPA